VLADRFGFSGKLSDPLVGVDAHDSEAMSLIGAYIHHRDGEIGPFFLVKAEQITVILLVDMVSGENQQQVAAVLGDQIAVLVQRTCGAAVPVLVAAPAVGLPDLEAVGPAAVQVPRLADGEVLHQRMRAVLS
jgi:hypothetical protein